MRILYVSQYFPPEIGAPAARVSELSRYWARQEEDVSVLTGFPNHPTGEVHPDYRKALWKLTKSERWEGVKVTRTWLWPLPNRKSIERILNYSSFMLSAIVRGLFMRKPDVVIGTSPQLLVGVAGWLLARLKRVPFVFEVRDIWPDAILASGVSRPGSALDRTLSAISRFLYRRADRIVVVTPAFLDELETRWGVPRQKMSLVVNGVETELFSPGDGAATRERLGVTDQFVVSYVGTVGYAHGIRTVLNAAQQMRDVSPEVIFFVVGEGAERETLQREVDSQGLTNVRFLGQLPREEIPQILRASDACLVLLKKTDAFKQVIPTKMLEFMSSGTPVVLGVEGQAQEIVEAAGGGVCIEPESVDELIGAIEELKGNSELRTRLGTSGREHMIGHYSREATAERYLEILKEVAGV